MRPQQPIYKSELDTYVPSEEEIIKHKIEDTWRWEWFDEEEKLMEQERELFEIENYDTD